MSNKKYKLAILTSHPIQYQVPFFKKLDKHFKIDLKVYFCSDDGVKKTKDSGFGQKIKWDIPLLEGYKYKFLKKYNLFFLKKPFLRINPEIIKELFLNKYNAIIVHGWASLTNWLVFFGSIFTHIPILLRAESPFSQERAKNRLRDKIRRFILRFLFKNISAFLYIGEENKKFYEFYGIPEEKLFFTPYAVDNERFIDEFKKLNQSKDKIKDELGIDKEKAVILFVGKLIDKKNPLDLLQAYEKINSNKKALVYVGDGRLRLKMERYIKNNRIKDVHLIGFKNQTELPKYYTMADIFVLPSGIGERWGLVVNEAMCFGLPIIVSDIVGCSPDLVKNGESGYVFSLGEIKKLAEYLKELIVDENKRKIFGQKSFEIIQNHRYKRDVEGIIKALESTRK
ncbi:MAG: glycosyltransferase family 4 protein [Candidatus Omnitrophica bacterium]|nr:glycosyltransferase family 4 protein [Candidatus Omnitrophota bacterium]